MRASLLQFLSKKSKKKREQAMERGSVMEMSAMGEEHPLSPSIYRTMIQRTED
jgi:hypothetical protein